MEDKITQQENRLGESTDGTKSTFFTIFFTTFGTVFIAELGDKTQIATMLLSAHSGQPFIVFIGAALALLLTSLIGVLIGTWITKVINPEKLEQIAGALMIALGIWLGLESLLYT